jgi:hypothetical protein
MDFNLASRFMVSRVYIKVRIKAQYHFNLAARKPPNPEEPRLALLVSVVGRWLDSKLLLVCFSQLHQPVRIRLYGLIDQLTLQAGISQLSAYPQRSVPASGMKTYEILHVPPIVHELLIAEPIDDLTADAGRITLVDQLAPQLR